MHAATSSVSLQAPTPLRWKRRHLFNGRSRLLQVVRRDSLLEIPAALVFLVILAVT
jgi:hypothetical protein